MGRRASASLRVDQLLGAGLDMGRRFEIAVADADRHSVFHTDGGVAGSEPGPTIQRPLAVPRSRRADRALEYDRAALVRP
jgi:hypothetical protein